jgi:hypothetical protein
MADVWTAPARMDRGSATSATGGGMKDESIRVTVDIAIFTIQDGHLRVLLVERGIPPYKR